MAILTNPRHEQFAQNLATGMSATEAYAKAGYKANEGNAWRLSRNEQVLERVSEAIAAVRPASINQRNAAFHGADLDISHPFAIADPFTIAVRAWCQCTVPIETVYIQPPCARCRSPSARVPAA